jgi:hypothetical protein
MYNYNINGSIEINTNKDLTEEEQEYGYSPVELSLDDGANNVRINAIYGLFLKDNGNYSGRLDKYGLRIYGANYSSHVINNSI